MNGFPEVKKKLGFGCMRLPMKDGEVDNAHFERMIDAFIGAGFNYFDTAHNYIDGKSERAIRECLVARYPRDSYLLADKLTYFMFENEEDILPLFEEQLKCCGVDYFDFYLFHALNANSYEKCKRCNAFAIVDELKKQGRVRHIALSFHDTAEVLDRILTEQPQVEAVQLQLNYLDFDDPAVQSKACYDVAVKHGKKIIVMEPVKGGTLACLPPQAAEVLDGMGGGSHASYAIRYAASYPEVFMVLSGMGSMDMINDNIGYMKDFEPLAPEEVEATVRVRHILRTLDKVPCTGCEYCLSACPVKINIPSVFTAYNSVIGASATREQAKSQLEGRVSPAECIGCRACEQLCPQKIVIPDRIADAVKKLRIQK